MIPNLFTGVDKIILFTRNGAKGGTDDRNRNREAWKRARLTYAAAKRMAEQEELHIQDLGGR